MSSSSSSSLVSDTTNVTLVDVCRSVQKLSDLSSPSRTLSSEDVGLATEVCRDLATRWCDVVARLHADPSVIIQVNPGVMDRVLLFKDEDVELRAHLFQPGFEETHVHNHGNAFISTCLQGGYVHKIWAPQSKEDHSHYSIERKPGGLLFEPVEQKDSVLSNVLCQPFQAGQSLFISSSAHHTVMVDKEQTLPVVTLVLRQTRRIARTEVLSPTPQIAAPVEEIRMATPEERQDILSRLGAAINYYRQRLDAHGGAAPPLDNFYFSIEMSTKLDKVLHGVQRLTRAEVDSQCRHVAIGITVYMLAITMAHTRWPESESGSGSRSGSALDPRRANVVFQELHWTLESLLERSIRPEDINAIRSNNPDDKQQAFKMLRIFSGAGERANGFQMAEDFIFRTSDDGAWPFLHQRLPDLSVSWRQDLRDRLERIQNGTADSRDRTLLLLEWACRYSRTMQVWASLFTKSVKDSMLPGDKKHLIQHEAASSPSSRQQYVDRDHDTAAAGSASASATSSSSSIPLASSRSNLTSTSRPLTGSQRRAQARANARK